MSNHGKFSVNNFFSKVRFNAIEEHNLVYKPWNMYLKNKLQVYKSLYNRFENKGVVIP